MLLQAAQTGAMWQQVCTPLDAVFELMREQEQRAEEVSREIGAAVGVVYARLAAATQIARVWRGHEMRLRLWDARALLLHAEMEEEMTLPMDMDMVNADILQSQRSRQCLEPRTQRSRIVLPVLGAEGTCKAVQAQRARWAQVQQEVAKRKHKKARVRREASEMAESKAALAADAKLAERLAKEWREGWSAREAKLQTRANEEKQRRQAVSLAEQECEWFDGMLGWAEWVRAEQEAERVRTHLRASLLGCVLTTAGAGLRLRGGGSVGSRMGGAGEGGGEGGAGDGGGEGGGGEGGGEGGGGKDGSEGGGGEGSGGEGRGEGGGGEGGGEGGGGEGGGEGGVGDGGGEEGGGGGSGGEGGGEGISGHRTKAIYEMKSAALAARARKRGPTISEQRAAVELPVVVGVQKKKKEKTQRSGRCVLAVTAEEVGGKPSKITRGRVRANAAQISVAGQAGLAALVDRQRSLLSAGKYRRTRLMVAVAPAGTADLATCPDRVNYPAGAMGDVEYEKDMRAFEAGNIGETGSENRTLDMYEREVGWFGWWLQQRGHAKAVEWTQEEGGWRLKPVIIQDNSTGMGDGAIVIPSVSSIIEYILKMATGDSSCPKGGTPEYRNGEWYLTCFGKQQGEYMREDNAKEYGHGQYADQPYRFVTIERKMTALRKWYDEVSLCGSTTLTTGSVLVKSECGT